MGEIGRQELWDFFVIETRKKSSNSKTHTYTHVYTSPAIQPSSTSFLEKSLLL